MNLSRVEDTHVSTWDCVILVDQIAHERDINQE